MTKVKETSTNFSNKQALAEECPEAYAVNLIGGQWSLVICSWLLEGKLRFGELKKKLPGITERMLPLQLRKLEQHKLVKRTVYPEVPPRVVYELTPIGKELKPIITQMVHWGERHKSITQSRDLKNSM